MTVDLGIAARREPQVESRDERDASLEEPRGVVDLRSNARARSWWMLSAPLAVLLMFAALPWLRSDFSVPVPLFGDTLWFLVGFKSLLQNGWTWFVPQLSAPTGLLAIAFPSNTTVDWALSWLLTPMFKQAGALLNAYWLLSVALTALTCGLALRCLRVSPLATFALALCYALLPWVFMRNVGHISLVYIWVPPLCLGAVYLALSAPDWLERPFRWFVIPACALQGFSYIYFAAFGAFFLLLGTLLGLRAGARRRVIRSGFLAFAVLVGCTVVNLAPSFYVWHRDGRPANMDYKSAQDAEKYGLKLRHLLSPSWNTPLPGLAQWGRRNVAAYSTDSEAASSRLGLVGSVGLVALLFALFRVSGARTTTDVRAKVDAAAARLVLGGLLLATVGGAGAIFNLLVRDIRAYSRISVFIAFFCFVGFEHLWNRGETMLRDHRKLRSVATALLLVFFAVALVDQMSDARILRARAEKDREGEHRLREFVGNIEARLPSGAALFELPQTSFPPDAGVERMGPYDHARPYLDSNALRWSWPTFSRKQQAIVDALASTPGPLLPAALVQRGFSAVWIDRFGYKDNGAATQRELADGGARVLLESSDARYVVMDLRGVTSSTQATSGFFGSPILEAGFDGWEGPVGSLAWTHGDAEIRLVNGFADAVSSVVEFDVGTLVPRGVSIAVNGQTRFAERLDRGGAQHVRIAFDAQPGVNRLRFATDTPAAQPSNGDPRRLAFFVRGFEWRPASTGGR